MINALKKQGIEGIFFNTIKAMYKQPIINIILNGEQLKPFPLNLGTTQECPLFPLLLYMILEFLARPIRPDQEIKGIQIVKDEIKLSLFADDMILY
jgi:hypothetical protein